MAGKLGVQMRQMRIVKSLLLGSAAGIVAVAGAHGADMPMKAKPVQYVKICTLYGDGYYYIPGSDTCIKFGGYVQSDYGYNVAGSRTPAYSGTQGAQDRTVAAFSARHRGNVQMDTRTQSQYGTLRTLIGLHFQQEDQTFSFTVAKALIQWAGFTFGHANSYSDTWSLNDSWHFIQQQNNSNTSANGVNQFAYTFELGNGVTLSFGADERRTKSIVNLSRYDALKVGAEAVNSTAGQNWPDPHVDFKIDQPWGYWAASGVVHDVRATYYTDGTTSCPNPAGLGPNGAVVSFCGHPGDKLGWAIMTGGEVKLPMIAQGDRAGYFAHFSQGAAGFGGGNNLGSPGLFGSGNNVAAGWITDGVYLNGTGIELTTAWSVGAGFEHRWTPQLKTSFTGAYTRISYDSTAKSYFASNVCGSVAGSSGQFGFNSVSNCNPDWSYFQGGVRTIWTLAPGFYVGADVGYTYIWTAFQGTASLAGTATSATTGAVTAINPVIGARPAGVYNLSNQGIISAIFRAKREFNVGGGGE
jgi:hypothetical protein